MKNMVKIEIRRAFCNKSFFISIFIGVLITGSQIFTWALPSSKWLDNYLLGKGEYPVSLFNTWIGATGQTFQLTLFFMVLPILACIPYSGSCFVDHECGYQMHILTKSGKYHYYAAKCTAVYLSGGIAVLIPLVVNLIATAMIVPALIPEASSRTFPIFEHSMWSGLFYTHPFYYTAGYFLLIFLYAGLFALWGILASFYLKNKYMVLLLPFIIYALAGFILSYTGNYKYSPELFLRPDQPAGADFNYICILYVAVLTGFIILLTYKGRKGEILD